MFSEQLVFEVIRGELVFREGLPEAHALIGLLMYDKVQVGVYRQVK